MDSRPRIIAGSARSGTTWVADALSISNGAATLFEPLDPDAIPQARTLANRRLGAEDESTHAASFFNDVFAGVHRNLWTLTRVKRQELALNAPLQLLGKARSALVNYFRYGRTGRGQWLYKLGRANLMLAWLERNFDARIALVIRHPGAVVASRVRRRWSWRPTLQTYLESVDVRRMLGDVAGAVAQIEDPVRGHAAIWCIQHAVALHDWEGSRFTVHFYEQLTSGHREEWQRLTSQLELAAMPSAQLLARPSQQADRGARGAPIGAHPRWRAAFSRPELGALGETLALFGNELYETGRDGPTQSAERYLETG